MERNKHHSRTNFFELRREPREATAEVWKTTFEVEQIGQVEEKTAAELIASKFLSVIGMNNKDKKLKKKIKHKLGLQLKEKHKRQLNHIRNCAANASASSRSSSSEALDSTLEANQNFIQQNDDTASLSSDLSRVQLSDSCWLSHLQYQFLQFSIHTGVFAVQLVSLCSTIAICIMSAF